MITVRDAEGEYQPHHNHLAKWKALDIMYQAVNTSEQRRSVLLYLLCSSCFPKMRKRPRKELSRLQAQMVKENIF